MAKRMTNKEKRERAAIKKKLQADGLLPPDKKRLNRKKFIDEAMDEFNGLMKECITSDIYLYRAVSVMLGMINGKAPTLEAVGVAKALKLAARLRQFDQMVKERGDKSYKVSEQYEYIKDILEA